MSEAAYHPSLHTYDYYEKINALLNGAASRDDAIEILKYIKIELQSGSL